jgi:inosine-uridine nucleoside N-ribohydrolase
MDVPKFLIDLDTGVDDAMALLVALHAHKRGRIRVVGITTVSGNADNDCVVRNTFRTLEVAQCADVMTLTTLMTQLT